MTTRRLSSLLLGLTALAAAGGLTLGATPPDAPQEQSPAAAAVHELVTGTAEEALAAVPADFADLRGYRPVIEDGRLVRADGDCSSPVTLPESFTALCQEHDYGYDLLRYAAQADQPLGRWARGAIDEHFAADLPTLCEGGPAGASCRRMATLAVAGVELNSLRQGDAVPEESTLTNAALATSAVGMLGLTAALVPGRRRR